VRILVTNDDGVYSPGLRLLYQFAEPLGKVSAVAPETPKSASGLEVALHMPQIVDVINVCFSQRQRRGVGAKLATPARFKYTQRIEASPWGAAYFWPYGEPPSPGPETDVYVVLKEGNVAVTPLALNLDALGNGQRARREELKALIDYVNAHL